MNLKQQPDWTTAEPHMQPSCLVIYTIALFTFDFARVIILIIALMQLEIVFLTLPFKVLYVGCNRRTVKNIPKYASAQFYIDNVLPRIKEKKIMSIKPFVDRLG
jgi:hypothetical protein